MARRWHGAVAPPSAGSVPSEASRPESDLVRNERGAAAPTALRLAVRATHALVLIGVALGRCSAAVRGGDAPATSLDPSRVTWRELQLEAHKLGVAAHIAIRLITPESAGTGTSRTPRADAGEAREVVARDVWIESTTRLPGRVFLARERLDLRRPSAFEIVDTETGVKHHRKAYELGDQGFTLDLLEPASLAELTLAPESWTRHVCTTFTYPPALGPAPEVTGPAGLLYALSAGDVTAPGDSMTVDVLVQTQVERVTIAAEGIETLQLDYDQIEDGRPIAVHEELKALRLVAHSSPVDPSAPSAFRIFGLEGMVEILWDTVRRLPLEMSGQVKLLGHVEVRLASVTRR